MDGSHFEQRFDSYRDYNAAVHRVLAEAKSELSVFDPDLSRCELETRKCAEAIEHLLLAGRGTRLRIVLHDIDYLERRCPRLMRLLARFSHCFEVRQSPEDLRSLTECYVLGEPDAGVVRLHRDWPRGKWFVANPDEAGVWRNRFRQLWECSAPAVPATRLGL